MLTSRLVEWLWASWWVARRRSRLGNELTCRSKSCLLPGQVSGQPPKCTASSPINQSITKSSLRCSKNPRGDFIQIDTTNILFVCGGAFVDLDRQVRRAALRCGALGMLGDAVWYMLCNAGCCWVCCAGLGCASCA